jgi:MazG family protein
VKRRPGDALAELDSITRRLRRECPWDREQDERSIVPHTVEEAYELADAAHSGDDSKLLDELGDVLFQVFFLALLLEERRAGDLAVVADGTIEKLVRRHPHVFGAGDEVPADLPTAARTAEEVRRNWDAIKRSEPAGADPLDGIPENLPSLSFARKALRRAGERPLPAESLDRLERAVGSARDACAEGAGEDEATHGTERAYAAVGDLLFEATRLSAALQVDPEIALRRSAESFRQRARDRAR